MGGSLSVQAVDLSSKVAVVTGGNAGIGYETAKSLAVMGAHTIIACRSAEKATSAIEQMRQEVSETHPDKSINVEFMKLDLSSFRSTKEFTVAFKEKNLPLHLLINNAGIFCVPLTLTEDGNELHFQVNHLSHFLLTLELLPIVLDTAANTGDCRIVILSSGAYQRGVFAPNNLNGEQSYGRLEFYENSKLFNVMHGYALQRRLRNKGITVSSLHPGMVNTQILEKGVSESVGLKALAKIAKTIIRPGMRNCQQGSMTTLNCAINPELNTQQHYYYADCQATPPSPRATNSELQEQLWEISVQKVKHWLSPEILEKYGTRMDVTTEAGLGTTENETTPTETGSNIIREEETAHPDEKATPAEDRMEGTNSSEQGEEMGTNDGTNTKEQSTVVEPSKETAVEEEEDQKTNKKGNETTPTDETSTVQDSEVEKKPNKQQEGVETEGGTAVTEEPVVQGDKTNKKDEEETEP